MRNGKQHNLCLSLHLGSVFALGHLALGQVALYIRLHVTGQILFQIRSELQSDR